MQRDKLYGLIIFAGAALVLFWYTFYALIYAGFYHGGIDRAVPDWVFFIATLNGILSYWGWAVILPIWIAALLILVIAMWIGWTMLTTPPPVPLEELEELGLDEEEEKKEEKKE